MNCVGAVEAVIKIPFDGFAQISCLFPGIFFGHYTEKGICLDSRIIPLTCLC